VNFTSSQVLTEPSNGQARIEATNKSSQVPVTDISFSLANGTFTDAIFNPFIGGTIGSPGDATITVMGQDAMANPETFTGTFSLGNGQNFFTVVASNDEVIDSISLSAINGFGFTDLRQVRISGATVPSVPETGTTLSLLGAGILALALLRRKLV
jgi:protein with PEP-CTERM/exosortase system signal